nr:hypothetical protein [Bacillota bacterium]
MASRVPGNIVDALARRLSDALGTAAVDAGGPALVVRPQDEEGVATALRLAAEALEGGGSGGHSAVPSAGTTPGGRDGAGAIHLPPLLAIRGRGSKQAWGDLPEGVPIVLETTGLRSGVRHDADDLVASAPAGLGWAEFQDQLGQAGQWVPLDPPLAGSATVGGVVAAATSGPRRVANGAVRDLVIGARAVLPGGRVIAPGGRVIKNVAGYDLCKVLVGSFGGLAVITEVTFKVLPLPQCRGWVTADFTGLQAAHRAAMAAVNSVLQPSAVQILWTGGRVRVRVDVDGDEAVVARQVRDLEALLAGAGVTAGAARAAGAAAAIEVAAEGPLPVADHRDLLGAVEAAPVSGCAVVRLGVPAAGLAAAWARAREHLAPLDAAPLRADAAAGLMWWVLPGPPVEAGSPAAERLAEAVARLDADLRAWTGYAALEAGPTAAHRNLGSRPSAAAELSRRVKAVFDPANMLPSPRLGL